LKTSGRRRYAAVPGAAALFFLCLSLSAAWIPIKADLAQWLIERSWRAGVAGGTTKPPWPWADTRPAAVLIVPRLGIRQFVLEGSSGRNLAFGPVFLDGTLDGADRVISGHRDTHFRFLRELRAGDRLQLTGRAASRWFEVRSLEVVDSRDRELVIEPGVERLSLVTCYPFDDPVAGGPLRYVVTAAPVSPRWPSSG
jgi:sortase A